VLPVPFIALLLSKYQLIFKPISALLRSLLTSFS
jgi:hypothetical protein